MLRHRNIGYMEDAERDIWMMNIKTFDWIHEFGWRTAIAVVSQIFIQNYTAQEYRGHGANSA